MNHPVHQTTISGAKKSLFLMLLILIPVAFIGAVELVLRLMDYGPELDLFIPYHANEDYYTPNPDVGLRYFPRSGMTGFGSVDAFARKKRVNTVRIFVLGGSSTAGFPYYFNGTFPSMLRPRLRTMYPGKIFEIINLGMTAVNSYTIRDLVRECLKFEPDLLIIYSGHNEFYGAFGSGSRYGTILSRSLTNWIIGLRRWRLYQLVRQLVNRFTDQPGDLIHGTLMSHMVAESSISYGGRCFRTTLDRYRKNIQDVITRSQRKRIPLVLGTVASNIRDQRPFVSLHVSGIDQAAIEDSLRNIRALVSRKYYQQALNRLEAILEQDSVYAQAHFIAGYCAELLGDSRSAAYHLELARDFDGLRFRAPSDINRILEELSTAEGVYLAPVETELRAASKGGLPGKELFLEHLHPTLRGHFLMARSFASTIQEYNLIAGHPVYSVNEDSLWSHLPVTAVDRKAAEYRIDILRSGWPFKPHRRYLTADQIKPQNSIEELALAFIRGEEGYWDMHMGSVEAAIQAGNPEGVRTELEALLHAFPNVWQSQRAMGEWLIEHQRYTETIPYLEAAIRLGADITIYKMAGTTLTALNQHQRAIPYLERVIAETPEDHVSRYNLSGAYYMTGRKEEALRELERIMREKPAYAPAKSFYNQIRH